MALQESADFIQAFVLIEIQDAVALLRLTICIWSVLRQRGSKR